MEDIMEATVVTFVLQQDARRLGWVLIKYGEIHLNCDLVYYIKDKKLWIRMPEVWTKRDTKIQFCYWPNRETSAEFQKNIIDQIYKNFNFDLESALKDRMKYKTIAKNKPKNLQCKAKALQKQGSKKGNLQKNPKNL
jgi:hypothetical protein